MSDDGEARKGERGDGTAERSDGDSTYHKARPWVKHVARLGYYARGVVYLLIGGLALRAAVGEAPRAEGPQGALFEVFTQPMGRVLLGVLALGLSAYALWRFVQAAMDPDDEGSDAGGLMSRAGHGVAGSIHALLAFQAFAILLGMEDDPGEAEDEETERLTAFGLELPGGRWIVGAIGVLIAGFGLTEVWVAWKTPFMKVMDLSPLGDAGRRAVKRLGQVGVLARGAVSGVIGWLLVRAALRLDPGEAGGLESALETVREQPYGPGLLGVVGVGMIAYGVFQVVEGRFRTIPRVW